MNNLRKISICVFVLIGISCGNSSSSNAPTNDNRPLGKVKFYSVGDKALFDIAGTQSDGKTYSGLYTHVITQYDAEASRYLFEEITKTDMYNSHVTIWFSTSFLKWNIQAVQKRFEECAVNNSFEKVTVPAGTFQVCRIEFNDQTYKTIGWLGNVPMFHTVKEIRINTTNSSAEEKVLRSFEYGQSK